MQVLAGASGLDRMGAFFLFFSIMGLLAVVIRTISICKDIHKSQKSQVMPLQ